MEEPKNKKKQIKVVSKAPISQHPLQLHSERVKNAIDVASYLKSRKASHQTPSNKQIKLSELDSSNSLKGAFEVLKVKEYSVNYSTKTTLIHFKTKKFLEQIEEKRPENDLLSPSALITEFLEFPIFLTPNLIELNGKISGELEWKELPSLTSIQLKKCGLTKFPEGFSNLKNPQKENRNKYWELFQLEILQLNNNKIVEIPDEIFNLFGLKKLWLHKNKIQKISGNIGRLKQLKELYLSENKIEEIGEEIGTIPNIEELTLHFNSISFLPSTIGNLTKLTQLSIQNNKLIQLPHTIGLLKQLSSLYLDDNSLSSLPVELLDIPNLKELTVSSNPNLSSASHFSTEELLDNLRDLREALTPLTSLKLVVLGKQAAGKTTLVHRLQDEKYTENISTDGIDTKEWNVKLPSVEVPSINFQIFDFGGQQVFYPTHQFFLSRKAIYLIVFNVNSNDYLSSISYWLRVLSTQIQGRPLPNVFLIGTH